MAKEKKVESAEKVVDESPPKRGGVRVLSDVSQKAYEELQWIAAGNPPRIKAEELMALASNFASAYRTRDPERRRENQFKEREASPIDARMSLLNRTIGIDRQLQLLDFALSDPARRRSSAVKGGKDVVHGRDSDKLTDLVKTWRNGNPIEEIGEVVDAMSAKGLVQSVSGAGKAGGPGNPPMTAADIEDVQAIIDRAIDRAAEQAEAKLAPFVKAITEEIESLKDSRLRTFVVLLVIQVMIAAVFAIINPVGDYYVKKWLEDKPHPTTPREFKQKVKKNTLSYESDRSDLQQFRFVSKLELEAHTHPSSRSPTVGRLPLGQVVVLLERRKAWSSVAWTVDDELPPVHAHRHANRAAAHRGDLR